MDAIDKTISLATEQTLTELSNKGIYKRALKEAEGMTLLAENKFDTYAVNISGELCTIKAPFQKASAAAFSVGFAARIFEYADSVNRLTKGDITEEMLGTFRREYSDPMGTLDILPIGTRAVSGEYEGCVYYFLNTDKRSPQRFFTYRDLRPTFYEKRSKRFREQPTVIWNLDTPLNNYIHTELKLKNAKVSMGHLSSSSKTEVTCVGPAQLNCTALRELIISDFAELAKKISETNSD